MTRPAEGGPDRAARAAADTAATKGGGPGKAATAGERHPAGRTSPIKSRATIVAVAALTAVIANLLIYAAGRAIGGSFQFTSAGKPAEVDAITVAGFSAVPLALGLTAVALLARHTWAIRTALIAGPALAILTILIMTIPAGFDATSTITLALCHLTLAPIVIIAVRRLAGTA